MFTLACRLALRLLGGYRAAAFALLAVLACGATSIQTMRLHHAENAAKRAADSSVTAALAASEAARKEEQTRARYMAGVDAAYQRGMTNARAAVAGVLDDVAAGRYVLRDHFRCPAVRSTPAPPAGASVSDAAASAVLSDGDVQFLVRFAGDAEGVRQQLIACQAVVAADREVIHAQ